MHDSMVVRTATMEDADAIEQQTSRVQQLHKDALPLIFKAPSAELFPPHKLAKLIQDPNCVVAVAELSGKVVGHIYGAIVRRTENEFHRADACMYVYQISVDDDARRQGIGKALLDFVRDRAEKLGLTALQVDHFAFNAHAKDFFEACGFLPVKVTMRQLLKA